MKFQVDPEKGKKQAAKRDKEFAQAEALLLQKAASQVQELKEVVPRQPRS